MGPVVIVLILMAVAMLPILLRARHPAYADPLYKREYPTQGPKPSAVVSPPLENNLSLGLLGLPFLGPGFCPGGPLACGGSILPRAARWCLLEALPGPRGLGESHSGAVQARRWEFMGLP